MNDPWAEILTGNGKRVNADGKFDFFWVNFSDDEPGLVLRLPEDNEEQLPLPKLRNIGLSYQHIHGRTLALRLKDNAHREVFAELCQDVISAAEDADTLNMAHARAIRRTKRWHYLLQGGRTKGLTSEEQRGLVGELQFLRQIIEVTSPATAVEAWRGPLGSSKDFEFPEVCVEVKARRGAAKPFVSISSCDQLSDVLGSRVFLKVFNVNSAIKPEGMNLHDHISATSTLLENHPETLDAWYELIYAAGYDEDDDYDQLRWIIGAQQEFEILAGFPRIEVPVHEGVDKVRYTVSLQSCEPYRCKEDLLCCIVKGITN